LVGINSFRMKVGLLWTS